MTPDQAVAQVGKGRGWHPAVTAHFVEVTPASWSDYDELVAAGVALIGAAERGTAPYGDLLGSAFLQRAEAEDKRGTSYEWMRKGWDALPAPIREQSEYMMSGADVAIRSGAGRAADVAGAYAGMFEAGFDAGADVARAAGSGAEEFAKDPKGWIEELLPFVLIAGGLYAWARS